jgi:hypothetical protein
MKEEYLGTTISAGCLFVMSNVIASLEELKTYEEKLNVLLSFGSLCAADKSFLSVKEKDIPQLLEMSKKAQEQALFLQKENK